MLLLSFCFALAADLHFFLVLHSFLSRPCPVRSVLHADSYCGSCYHIAYNCTCSSWHFSCIVHEEWWWDLEGMNFFNIKVNKVLKFHVPLLVTEGMLEITPCYLWNETVKFFFCFASRCKAVWKGESGTLS